LVAEIGKDMIEKVFKWASRLKGYSLLTLEAKGKKNQALAAKSSLEKRDLPKDWL